MLFDTKTEELWIKYLNPKETIFPAEIHELARGLLDAYRKITLDKGDLNDEPTLPDFIARMIKEYGKYIEEFARKYIIEGIYSFNRRSFVLPWMGLRSTSCKIILDSYLLHQAFLD